MAIPVQKTVYRQDKILKLPFPDPPSLAGQISNGVLKREDAQRYDQLLVRDRESVMNIIRLTLETPDLTALRKLISDLAAKEAQDITGLGALIAALQVRLGIVEAQILALQVQVASIQTQVTDLAATISAIQATLISLQNSIFNLTNQIIYILDQETPLITLAVSGLTPNLPLIFGKSGIFGNQRATNSIDGGFWTWNGNDWSPG